ncbi:AhpD-like protein [Hyaloraphidium curvatum]|nr:AhpD-like protein [Hyaloraphidium curvatum]
MAAVLLRCGRSPPSQDPMAFLPSLRPGPDEPPFVTLRSLLTKYPPFVAPLLEMEEAIMRPDTAASEAAGQKQTLTVADRELIAAFTSALNSCKWCLGVHEKVAVKFGVDPAALRAALVDINASPFDARRKAMLHYVKKVALEPPKVTARDVQAMLSEGLTERDVFDACSACAMFSFMNRLTSCLGCEGNHETYEAQAKALVEVGYAKLAPPRNP